MHAVLLLLKLLLLKLLLKLLLLKLLLLLLLFLNNNLCCIHSNDHINKKANPNYDSHTYRRYDELLNAPMGMGNSGILLELKIQSENAFKLLHFIMFYRPTRTFRMSRMKYNYNCMSNDSLLSYLSNRSQCESQSRLGGNHIWRTSWIGHWTYSF